MTIFSSLQQAAREGFEWVEYQPQTAMHLVVKTLLRKDGLKSRALAFAKPDPVEADSSIEAVLTPA